jgi:hypothetical protein
MPSDHTESTEIEAPLPYFPWPTSEYNGEWPDGWERKGYLPLDCPNCGRRRLEYALRPDGGGGILLQCEKCHAASFGTKRVACPECEGDPHRFPTQWCPRCVGKHLHGDDEGFIFVADWPEDNKVMLSDLGGTSERPDRDES